MLSVSTGNLVQYWNCRRSSNGELKKSEIDRSSLESVLNCSDSDPNSPHLRRKYGLWHTYMSTPNVFDVKGEVGFPAALCSNLCGDKTPMAADKSHFEVGKRPASATTYPYNHGTIGRGD